MVAFSAKNIRDTLESKHIGKLIAENREGEYFTIGLLTNCTDLLGMLDRSAWDSCGSMSVAIAAGMCLTHLRLKAGLDPSEVRGHPLTAPEGLSLQAAYRLIEGAIKGIKKRQAQPA